ncbi:vitamin B12 dependent-methionine synthase activation domain-containing protein [Helicovermis profundi]|uniref:Vitamin B12 dependent-methionine synthase activation domain-containing protein n=1 Tax=Helicovermis profundi TaxID=3065157 RepID=A0AAU9E869_9FIRM|nr:vitamin B12 dependent-methionine synthase activation domain-containing protein [Clostridia bacterium S502]
MINKDEVFRYLGYSKDKKDLLTKNKLEQIVNEIEKEIKGKYTFKEYIIETNTKNKVTLKNSSIVLSGKDISKHLIDSKRIVILAVTLGIDAERYIIKKNYLSALDGLISDACMSDLTEYYADECEKQIKSTIKANEKTTFRYSPGYGDLPLNTQKNIIEELNTNRIIGLNITDSYILTPRKSVIAIIGIEDINSKVKKNHRCGVDNCRECKLYSSCNFKKGCVI